MFYCLWDNFEPEYIASSIFEFKISPIGRRVIEYLTVGIFGLSSDLQIPMLFSIKSYLEIELSTRWCAYLKMFRCISKILF